MAKINPIEKKKS